MDYALRIATRMYEQNGPIYIGATVAVIVLILLVVVGRRMRKNKQAGEAVANPLADDAADSGLDMTMDGPDDIELSMIDEPVPGDSVSDKAGDAMVFEVDETPPDQLEAAAAHQFDMDDDVLGDIDDITIPKVGEAPPAKKSRFFSASWLHRDKGNQAPMVSAEVEPPDARTMNAAAECARLAEIERNMLALRELYEAGLIAPEVYVLKAREFAAQSG